MKAAWLERYSKEEPRLTVGEQPVPSLGAKDVLLRVGVAAAHASDILEKHGVRPAVDGVFALDEVNAALKKVAGGGSAGKTVIRI